MKKCASYILIVIALLGIYNFSATTVHAQTAQDPTYHLLAPIGGLSTFDPTSTSSSNALGQYLNILIGIIIGLSAVFAIVMIVIGGIQYMTSELISSKEEGKERIEHALLGLVIALGAYALLNTINPNLLNSNISIQGATVDVSVRNDNVPQQPTIVNGVKSYTTGGQTYASGSSLATDFPNASLAQLPAGVTVYNQQCATVGQTNCTSTLGLNTSIINSIESGCTQSSGSTCQIQITGGTEFWLHNGGTGHTLGSPDVDLQDTPALDKYLTGGTSSSFPAGYVYSAANTCYYAEPAGDTAATTGQHWHVYPMPSSGQC